MNLPFSQPAVHFSNADPNTVGALVATASDIALIVSRSGIVEDVAGESGHLAKVGAEGWRGRRFEEVVDADSRQRVRRLIGSGSPVDLPEILDVTHGTASGDRVQLRYSAVSAGNGGDLVLLGRDLSPLRTLQDRLLTSQQIMERNIERQRQDEARYRMLFQIGSEAALIVDAASGRICEANQAATELTDIDASDLAGRDLRALFAGSDRPAIDAMLSQAARASVPVGATAGLDGTARTLSLRATLCPFGDVATVLVHLDRIGDKPADDTPERTLSDLIHVANEAVVLVGDDGAVLWANDSFVNLTHAASVNSLIGTFLGVYFDTDEFDIGVTLENVRRHGRLRMLHAKLRGATGQSTDVEMSVVAMPDTNPSGFGFVIRNIALRLSPAARRDPGSALAGETIEDVIGKVPLKELVRDEVDVVEKSCIEAALNLTGNNRALTAKVLGLSRQGLYGKMRRFGMIAEED